MKKVLIVVDMQNDFITGALGTPQAAGIVGGIKGKVEEYLAAKDYVLFTADTHHEGDYIGEETSVESSAIPRHCIEGEDGWQIVPELRPLAQGRILRKPAFLSTSLAETLRGRYGNDLSLELCGVCTDICVVSNALLLRGEFPDSPIVVDSALCAGTTPEHHQAALVVMGSCLVQVQ